MTESSTAVPAAASVVVRRTDVPATDEAGARYGVDVVVGLDGRIAAVTSTPFAGTAGTEIDGRGTITLPGLVDTHRHLWTTPLRGASSDLTVFGYREFTKSVIAPAMTPDAVYVATLAGALDVLAHGITTVVDLAHIMASPEHADASVRALRDAGVRAVLAHAPPNGLEAESWFQDSARHHPDDVRRLRSEVLHDDDALVRLGLGIRPPFAVRPDVIEHDVRLARELDIRMTFDGIGAAIGAPGRWATPQSSAVIALRDRDLLGPDMTFVHLNHVPDADLRAVVDAGAHISSAPITELSCGYGSPVVGRAARLGANISLSGDTVTQASGDLIEAARLALLCDRGARADAAYRGSEEPLDTWTLTSTDVLRHATLGGAAAAGIDRETGAVTPGRRADLVVLERPSGTSGCEPEVAVVHFAHAGHVRDVMVDGTLVRRDGRSTHPRATTIADEVDQLRESLTQGGSLVPTERARGAWRW